MANFSTFKSQDTNQHRVKERESAFLQLNKLSSLDKENIPDILGEVGRDEWVRVTTLLGTILKECDRQILTSMCFEWEKYVKTELLIAKEGAVIKDRFGEKVLNPLRMVAKDSWGRFKELAVHFGMTPNARMKIKVPEVIKVEDNKLAILK